MGDVAARGLPMPNLRPKPMLTMAILTTDTDMDTELPDTDTPMSTDSANVPLNPNLTMVSTVTPTLMVPVSPDTPLVPLTLKEAHKVSVAKGLLMKQKPPNKLMEPIPMVANLL